MLDFKKHYSEMLIAGIVFLIIGFLSKVVALIYAGGGLIILGAISLAEMRLKRTGSKITFYAILIIISGLGICLYK